VGICKWCGAYKSPVSGVTKASPFVLCPQWPAMRVNADVIVMMLWCEIVLWTTRSTVRSKLTAGLRMRTVAWNRFPLGKNADKFNCVIFEKTSYLNADMRKFESSQKDESRAQRAHSVKAYNKPRAFNFSIKERWYALTFLSWTRAWSKLTKIWKWG